MHSVTTAITSRSYRRKASRDWRAGLLRVVLVLLLVPGLAACSMVKTKSKQEALKEIEWAYQKDGIEIEVLAAPQLNMWGGQPHTLLMVVTQLQDPSAFEKYTQNQNQLAALLLAESAPEGLLTQQKYFIEPDSTRKFSLARVENAKYVAVALGYQHLDPERSTRVYQIGADLDYSGLAFREYHAEPMPLRIQIRLGNESVQDSLTARQHQPDAPHPLPGMVVPSSRAAPPAPAVEVIRFSSPLPAPAADPLHVPGTQ